MLRLGIFRFFVKLLLFSGIALPLHAVSASAADDGQARKMKPGHEPFLLFEYFTSENCRRCTTIDALVAAVHEDCQQRGDKAMLLEFHVDYLNTAAARDAWSKVGFSERQFKYSQFFKEERAQAGGLVINGESAFLGSEQNKIERAIYRAKMRPARAALSVQAEYEPRRRLLRLKFEVEGLQKIRREFFYFHGALLQDGLKRLVKTGPNFGESLVHDSLVREFETARFDAGGKGSLEISVPEDYGAANAKIVCFVQDPENMKVLGAEMLSVPRKP